MPSALATKFVEVPVPALCRAYSTVTLKAVQDSSGKRRIEGIATTPTPDRMEDVVEPLGAQFSLPVPLLAYHDSQKPIGQVTSATVSKDGISITADVPQDTGLTYLEVAWKQIQSGLIRGLSIGFRPLEWTFMEETGGYRFVKWEWLELSAVTIPAQQEATIQLVKALDRRADLAALGAGSDGGRASPSAPRQVPHPTTGKTMKLSERIEAKQEEIGKFKDQMATVVAAFADREATDSEAAQINELKLSIDKSTNALDVLTTAEAALGRRAEEHGNTGASLENKSAAILPRRPARKDAASLIFKGATVFLVAHATKKALSDVLKERYPTDDEVATIVKAAVNPADTVTPGWAAELVGTQIAEFIDVLKTVSVYGAIAGRSLRVTFDRNGIIKVPSRLATPNLAGVFVGEGGAIPVKRGALSSVSLTPHKAGVISTFTRELAQMSNPSIEAIIREGIVDDTGVQIDANLLDAVAANAVRPAGLMNGITATASGGVTPANITTDMRVLMTALTASGGGRDLALLINPLRIVGLNTATNAAGQFVFRDEVARGTLFGATIIASTHVPVGTVILIDLADFVTASGDTPEWSVSDVATIHEEDTAPLPLVDNAGAVAQPVRSLWQTASIGIRMIWPLTWAMRRPGMIAALSGVAW